MIDIVDIGAAAEHEETTVPYRPPFVRITGTYPAGDDQYTTLAVELNLSDDETDLADATDTDNDNAVHGWMIEFVTSVLRELRSRPPISVLIDGQLRDLFADLAGTHSTTGPADGGEAAPERTEGGA